MAKKKINEIQGNTGVMSLDDFNNTYDYDWGKYSKKTVSQSNKKSNDVRTINNDEINKQINTVNDLRKKSKEDSRKTLEITSKNNLKKPDLLKNQIEKDDLLNVRKISKEDSIEYSKAKEKEKKSKEEYEKYNKKILNDAKKTMSDEEYKDFKIRTGNASFGQKALQTGANLASGAGKGIQGVVDVPFQEIENNLQKGEKTTKEPVKESLKTLGTVLSPTVSSIAKLPGRIKENIDVLTDKNKGFWEKVGSLGKTGIETANDTVNSIGAGNSLIGATQQLGRTYKLSTGKNASEKVQKAQDIVDSPFNSFSNYVAEGNAKYDPNVYGKDEQFIYNAASSLGNMIPSTVASIATKNPEIGLAAMGLSARGQSTEEARARGMSLDDAINVGNIKAAIEIATEKLTGGVNVFGKGALDDIVERGIDKAVTNNVMNFLAKKGIGIVGEIGEETISDILNTAIDKATVDPNTKYTIKDWSDTALTTALTTFVLNALGGGYTPRAYNQNKMQQVQNIINQKNEGKITASQANEMLKQVDVGTYEQNQTLDRIAQEKVNEISNNPNLTQGEKADLINALNETVQQQRDNINSKTQNTLNGESLQQNNTNTHIATNNVVDNVKKAVNESQNKIRNAKNIVESKEKQLKIIQETNPMNDEYHTGIRNVNDIKTFEETINDEDSFNWGDFTREDAKKALKTGEIKIYSSKDIKNGDFVSTSYQQAYEYAGRDASKVKSKIVPLENVAWINGDEGQYAKVESNKSNVKNNNSTETMSEKKTKAEEILRINEDGTSDVISDRPKVLEKMPNEKKSKKTFKQELTDMQIAFTNRNAELDRISKKTKNNMLKTETDRLGLAPSESQQNIGVAQRNNDGVLYKNFTDEKGNKVSMSLDGIWEDANKNGITDSELQKYLIAQLNLDRLNQGVDQFNIPAYESEEIIENVESEHPEIKRIAENIWQYQKNQLQKKVDAGLVSKDSQEYFNENTPHYVRIQRKVGKKGSSVMSAFNGNITMKNTIQNVKGSIEDILPLHETMAQYEIESTNAIRKNNVLKELAKSLDYGEEVDKISIDGNLSINPELIVKNEDGSYTATFFKDGNAYQIPINEGIYEALSGNAQYRWENSRFLKLPKFISKIQRALLTDKNPLFMATNFFKDFGDAPLNSKYSTAKFLKNYPRAISDLFGKNGKFARLYEALGGSDNSYFKDGQFVEKTKSKAGKVVDKVLLPIEAGNEFIEKLPRLTEFITTIESNGYTVNENGELVSMKNKVPKKSASEVLSEAMYNAAEITTNFKRGGKFTKALNRNGATFLNASVQGFSKQIRNFTEIQNPKQAVKLLSKAVILGIAPALLNSAMYKDDEEYEDLPDYVKDEYYLFKGEDGKWIRIPKGRAVSVIGGAARHTKETVERKEKASKAFGAWTDLAKTQIAPNSIFDSNVFAPILQVKNNKSWSGNKIVSDSLSNSVHPEEEYDAKTSSLSKWLGEKLNASPKKIDYLIDQYSGGIGDVVQPFMTNYAESDDDSTAGKLFLNPLKSKFTADSVYNNKTVSDFYDAMEKLESEKKYSKSTTTDKAKYSYIDSANKRIAELYKEQKTIQNDTSLTDSEKYKQARDKQKEIISAMKDAMDKVKEAKTKNGMTKIGDKYYKETKDEDGNYQTSKINDKTVEKANELGIDIDIYSKATSDIYNIHDIKDSSGKVIKTRKQQIIDYIQGLNLTAEEKKNLYNKYYKK